MSAAVEVADGFFEHVDLLLHLKIELFLGLLQRVLLASNVDGELALLFTRCVDLKLLVAITVTERRVSGLVDDGGVVNSFIFRRFLPLVILITLQRPEFIPQLRSIHQVLGTS